MEGGSILYNAILKPIKVQKIFNNIILKVKLLWRYWWFRSVIMVALVVTIDYFVASSFLGVNRGFLTKPVWFFIEEAILEELLGVSDLLYFIYLYSHLAALLVPLIISITFYSFLVGIIVWSVETRHVLRGILVLTLTGTLLSVMFIHAFQLSFSEYQCDPTQSDKGLIMRSCWGGYRPNFSIPDRLYNSTEPLTQELFEGIVIADEEFEELKKHDGNFGYFCNTGCHLDDFTCRFDLYKTCRDCVKSCYQDAKNRGGINHVVDLLKSDKFLKCWNRCRP